jgi:hypothetical protein
MMEKHQRPPYNGTLRESGREEDQKIFGEDRLSEKVGKSWNELSFVAADRQKWKEFVDNLHS